MTNDHFGTIATQRAEWSAWTEYHNKHDSVRKHRNLHHEMRRSNTDNEDDDDDVDNDDDNGDEDDDDDDKNTNNNNSAHTINYWYSKWKKERSALHKIREKNHDNSEKIWVSVYRKAEIARPFHMYTRLGWWLMTDKFETKSRVHSQKNSLL